MPNPESPTQFGKYVNPQRIGKGGFSVVYRGRDPFLEREVAIKVLNADLSATPDFVERFRREARLSASLNHPNIVSVIEVGEQEGHYFIVMNYLPGGSLADRLQASKPLPLSQAIEWLEPIAAALDYAHANRVIHRDVKPTNILFTKEGLPQLADFGLVKSQAEDSLTTTGMALGTPEYMAPEQIQGGDAGPATDLYALGVIAYQMLCGQTPFKGNTPYEVQNAHINQPPPDPRALNPALPAEASGTLLRALAKEPAGRFSTGRELVNELKKVYNQLSSEKAAGLEAAARRQMEAMQFPQAIASLEELLALQPGDTAEALLSECRRRQKIWGEVTELLQKQSQALVQVSQLVKDEPWIKSQMTKFPASSVLAKSSASTTPTARINKVLLILAILVTLAINLLALVFLIGLPPQTAIVGLYYNPIFNQPGEATHFQYVLNPAWLGVLLAVPLVCWVAYLVLSLRKSS